MAEAAPVIRSVSEARRLTVVAGGDPREVERVVCVPADAFAPHRFRGFLPGAPGVLSAFYGAHRIRSIPRVKGPGGLEEDKSWKQLVAVVLLRCGDRALVCRRKGGGEGRLEGKLTLGCSGHVNHDDAPGVQVGRPDWHRAVRNAAVRELHEEFVFGSDPSGGLRLVGLVNDDDGGVGDHHLGVVFQCWHDGHSKLDVRPSGGLANHPVWYSAEQLAALGDDPGAESWTRILVREFLSRPAEEFDKWEAEDPETFAGTCERCGKERPLQLVEDPFVSGEIVDAPAGLIHSWCRPCYRTRAEDV